MTSTLLLKSSSWPALPLVSSLGLEGGAVCDDCNELLPSAPALAWTAEGRACSVPAWWGSTALASVPSLLGGGGGCALAKVVGPPLDMGL